MNEDSDFIPARFQKFFTEIPIVLKVALYVGIVLFLYGSLAQMLSIYFFWESRVLGYVLILCSVSIVAIVEFFIAIKVFDPFYREGWRTLFTLIFSGMFLGLQLLFAFSDSLEIAKREIESNAVIKSEVGQITGFGWITDGGSIKTSGNTLHSSTHAILTLIVKGENAFAFVTVELHEVDGEWESKIINE
ncbi:MAG: hypothetical protein KF775_07180 [Cyclobacteriaceae bacterium]|nr:hypothetical protein [Cyclobacteriaceae bacterium]